MYNKSLKLIKQSGVERRLVCGGRVGWGGGEGRFR